MCGRYRLDAAVDEVAAAFDAEPSPDLEHVRVAERYNIAPTQGVAVVVPRPDGSAGPDRLLTAMRWGIIPQWMKPEEGGKPPAGWINARAETAAEKPAFRGAFKYRRCVVPATGFYEWQKPESGPDRGHKVPHAVAPADGGCLGFAGLWETWSAPDGSKLDTVTILTTAPNAEMRELHDRMPVVLDPADHDRWMTTPPEEAPSLTTLLRPAPDGTLEATPVSRRVNNPRHDDASCLEPADPTTLF